MAHQHALSEAEIMRIVSEAAMKGLKAGVEIIGDQSDQNAPYEHGDLKDSRKIVEEPDRLRVKISYGEGLPDPRAVIVHEKMDIHHSHGGPKYLERALHSEESAALDAVASKIRQELS